MRIPEAALAKLRGVFCSAVVSDAQTVRAMHAEFYTSTSRNGGKGSRGDGDGDGGGKGKGDDDGGYLMWQGCV